MGIDDNYFGAGLTNFWSTLISTITVIVAFVALIINTILARKNIRLSIHKTIIDIVNQKVIECNTIWDTVQNEITRDKRVVSEIIITNEVLVRSLDLFHDKSRFSINNTEDYYYIFWKQLRTNLREYIRKEYQREAINHPNEVYTQQLQHIYKMFGKLMEDEK
ncbi:MAG: hypothetical protein FJY07_14635 [Bacteroidetes bacterium]|nr:hypothetical protein [Bacteroidota bacterium]